MKKILLLCFLSGTTLMAQDIKLGKSIISPDYIEVEKLKSTKNVVVVEK